MTAGWGWVIYCIYMIGQALLRGEGTGFSHKAWKPNPDEQQASCRGGILFFPWAGAIRSPIAVLSGDPQA